MEFKKVQLHYINPLYSLYIFLRTRVIVSNIWYGIRNILEKMPIKYRNQLLNKDVK